MDWSRGQRSLRWRPSFACLPSAWLNTTTRVLNLRALNLPGSPALPDRPAPPSRTALRGRPALRGRVRIRVPPAPHLRLLTVTPPGRAIPPGRGQLPRDMRNGPVAPATRRGQPPPDMRSVPAQTPATLLGPIHPCPSRIASRSPATGPSIRAHRITAPVRARRRLGFSRISRPRLDTCSHG